MVLSPSKESKSARSPVKPDCFQENLGSEVRGVKEGTVGESVLQVSDLPNRMTGSKARSMSMGALSELGRYNSQPQQQPSPGKQLRGGVILEPNDKIDVFELQGVPGMNPRSDSLAGTNARDEHVSEEAEAKVEAAGAPAEVPSNTCLIPAVQVTDEAETCTPGRVIDPDVKAGALPGDTLHNSDDVSESAHVDDVMLEFREAVTALPSSFGVFFQDVKKSPASLSDNSDELHKTSAGKDLSGDWSDGGHRRMERVVPEETLRNTREFDEDTDLAPLPISGPISAVGYSGPISAVPFSGPISAAPGYSGPIYSNAGSISRRSDSCNTSTRSFAFPILPGYEWNASPVRMPPPDKKRANWRAWLCCSKPATLE